MTVTAVPDESIERARRELARREIRRRKCREHPAFLGAFVHAVDAKTGEEFDFDLLDADERKDVGLKGEPGGWHWQRKILDSWLVQKLSLELKARQIGITWLAGLLALWFALFKPGTRVLILSVNEEEAKKVVARIWGLYRSLPEYLKGHVRVTKPARGGDPSQEIEFTHITDLRKTTILALPATEKAGHGETAALVILDEYSRQDFARSIWKGVFPVIDGGGSIIAPSTANGVSNELTGEGNFFHYLWVNASSMNIKERFLPWSLHPGRDEAWYNEVANSLPPLERAEQYPADPEDAFISTGQCWFDLDKLNAYQKRWRESERKVLYRLRFDEEPPTRGRDFAQARKVKGANGPWRIYVEPKLGHEYAVACDVATGKGTDFSSAHVIDLGTRQWVAEYHARVGEDVFAESLYYIGRMYGGALIAVENQGGYGTAVIIQLRDGVKGRQAYTNLYRHMTGPDRGVQVRERQDFGYRMNTETRPLVINLLEAGIREQTLPWITPDLDGELRTFSVAKSLPSPRAQDGCNDDRVMSAAISLDLYRQFGRHPRKRKRPKPRSNWEKAMYPWEA